MSAAEIAARAGGTVAGEADAIAHGFAFDSRALEYGDCFVALRGHRDGHDFVEHAFATGATVALVDHVPDRIDERIHTGRAFVVVPDPQAALAAIATSVRAERSDLAVIGITGSSGKTSTKDMLHAALSTTGAVHSNRDSFNNEVGLPLTLLGIDDATRYVVTEMGARFAGNIADLCAIAAPTVGVVTNIGLAHAEHLGGQAGIARVKGELVQALPADGLAVLNADDAWTPAIAERAACRVVRVGEAPDADVRITDVTLGDDLRARCRVDGIEISVPLRGAHQVHNAAQAVAVALHLGVPAADVVAGLAAAEGSRWRMELERSADGVVVLNDAYNANPASMAAAVRALAHLPVGGRRIAVLGDMRELGDHADDAHREIGALLGELRIDELIGVGKGGAAIAAAAPAVTSTVVDDAPGALGVLRDHARPGDAVLVKASRAIGLEVVAAALLDSTQVDEAGSVAS
jgi:UDP-N-acetylmuramoyl-tripeptide--D-alanyl-D-alanine ligase